MSINPLVPNQGAIIKAQSGAVRKRVAAADIALSRTSSLPYVVETQQTTATIIMARSMSIDVEVTWPRQVDGATTWDTGDATVATVVANATDSTRATITANDDDAGMIDIEASALAGTRQLNATIGVCVLGDEVQQGTIEVVG